MLKKIKISLVITAFIVIVGAALKVSKFEIGNILILAGAIGFISSLLLFIVKVRTNAGKR